MTQLHIPSVGDELTLAADWTFGLWNEDRNTSLMEFVGDTREVGWDRYSSTRPLNTIPCTIPAGSVLKIDRIYIRKGKDDFDSITFLWKGARTKRQERPRVASFFQGGKAIKEEWIEKIPARPVRFWVKLEDANKIIFE